MKTMQEDKVSKSYSKATKIIHLCLFAKYRHLFLSVGIVFYLYLVFKWKKPLGG